MSRSIHTTYKDVKGLTKKELIEQYNDSDSDLTKLAKKSALKKEVKKNRKLNICFTTKFQSNYYALFNS
jgi:hypothetical protein